tara:strand:+ start:173 stop:574 length:402 start_codon:yes stop_codon:yes gene_type:complete
MISASLMCLALNVYHESRSDVISGQYAVALTTINRVQSNNFPDSVCSVVHQGYHKGRHRCQFSWYCDGKSDKPYEELQWAMALLVASDVIQGNVPDFTKGSDHYHATYVKPYWAKQMQYVGQYGSHLFYKENR